MTFEPALNEALDMILSEGGDLDPRFITSRRGGDELDRPRALRELAIELSYWRMRLDEAKGGRATYVDPLH